MKLQLLNYAISLFDDKVTASMSAKTGASPIQVQQALESIIPVIMWGFASKSAEGPEKTNEILKIAREATNSSWWQQISDFFSQSDLLEKGREILHDLFGGSDNMLRISEGIARKSNIKQSSAETLMQMAAPLCLGSIGKYATEQGMDAGKLASWLATQKPDFDESPLASDRPAMPPGNSKPVPAEKGNRTGLWLLLLALLIIGVLTWYWLRGCNTSDQSTNSSDSTFISGTLPETQVTAPTFKINADSTISYIYSAPVPLQLHDDNTLTVPGNSAEAILYAKIQDALKNGVDTTEAGKASGWVNLYDVQFLKGLTYCKGAPEQIENIAVILKAFPQVHIKIGGYTDATGSENQNIKLSQQRADMVAKGLADMDLKEQISGAEGYGPAFPVAENTTAEGRAQNRRVSCRIVSVSK